jgi:hypothetical protein
MTTFHHVKLADIERLEERFAKRTPFGWVIPPWLKLLRNTRRSKTFFFWTSLRQIVLQLTHTNRRKK